MISFFFFFSSPTSKHVQTLLMNSILCMWTARWTLHKQISTVKGHCPPNPSVSIPKNEFSTCMYNSDQVDLGMLPGIQPITCRTPENGCACLLLANSQTLFSSASMAHTKCPTSIADMQLQTDLYRVKGVFRILEYKPDNVMRVLSFNLIFNLTSTY